MARVSSTVRVLEPTDEVTQTVTLYKKYQADAKAAQDLQKPLRDRLLDILESEGYTDDSGSYWLDLDGEVDGTVAVKRERRVSRRIDDESAKDILTRLGLADRCMKTIQVVDEDAVMAALYDGEINDADLDTIFPEKVTWALVLK